MAIDRRGRFRNWAGTQGCAPRAVHRPASEEDVVALVRDARERGETVRAVGAGHSWTDAACTDGHLVSLDAMGRVLDVGSAGRVRVEAGIRLRDLIEALDAEGLALPNVGSIAEQSLAGAVATGTHGSGLKHGNLATQIVGLRMVTGAGEVVELTRADDPDTFPASVVALGALGVVTELTLQAVPAFDLVLDVHILRVEDALAALPELHAGHEFMKLWWLPHTNRVQVSTLDRTDQKRTRLSIGERVDRRMGGVFAALLGLGRLAPPLVPSINKLVGVTYFKDALRVDRSDRVLTVPMPPNHLEMEYAIPVEHTADALRAVREMMKDRGFRVGFVQELRFVAADDLWLSPAHRRASCHFGGYVPIGRHAQSYLDAFEDLMLGFDGRPHWGKMFSAPAERLREVVPRLADFDALRRTMDPEGVFRNAFTDRIFGP